MSRCRTKRAARCATHHACECLRRRLALLMTMERAVRALLQAAAGDTWPGVAAMASVRDALAEYDAFDAELRAAQRGRPL